jgi:adenine-specific DNA-methyltransferase
MAKNDFSNFYFEKVCVKSNSLSLVDIGKNSTNKEAQLVNVFNKPELLTEILLKNGFNLNFVAKVQNNIATSEVFLASDGEKETLICLDVIINPETVDYFKSYTGKKFICLERA